MAGVSIHRGEIRQIKRMIKESRLSRGDLYGLYTESGQPVVQIVCAGQNGKMISEYKEILEEHSLLKIGEWFVGKSNNSSDINVELQFNDKGQLCRINKVTKLEILEGQSAFRIFPTVTELFQNITGLESKGLSNSYDDKDDILQLKDEHQWYFTPEGEKLFGQIYASLPKYGFPIDGMTRDTSTQDMYMTILLKRQRQGEEDMDKVKLYFPHDFPMSNPRVHGRNQHVETLNIERIREKGKDLAELLCSCLVELIKQSFQKEEHDRDDQEEKHKRNLQLSGETSNRPEDEKREKEQCTAEVGDQSQDNTKQDVSGEEMSSTNDSTDKVMISDDNSQLRQNETTQEEPMECDNGTPV